MRTPQHQSTADVEVSRDEVFGSSTSLGIAAQPLVPAAYFMYSALHSQSHRFTTKKSSYPDTIVRGGRESGTSFSNYFFLRHLHISLSLMHSHTHTHREKMQTDVTAGL